MYEFQIARAAYCLQNGLKEDGQDPSRMTIDELNDLKKRVKNGTP